MSLDEKGESNTDVGGPELGKVYWEKDLKQSIKELKEWYENSDDQRSFEKFLKETFGKGLI